MNRDDLVECLAREMADVREDVTWERVSENRKFLYRGDAASMLPGVVAFVATYMREWDDDACQVMADMWCEEMGT